jgi:hypothetical protein
MTGDSNVNILFLTNDEIGDIDSQGIFIDLMKEFSKDNVVYIVCANERRNKQKTTVSSHHNLNILRVKTGNITQVNFIEKGISTLLVNYHFNQAIKKHFNDIKFDLIIYSTPPITLYKLVKRLKNKYNSKTYLLLKDIFPQNAVDLGIFTRNNLLYKYFRYVEKKYYLISDYIGTMSKRNSEYLINNNTELKNKNIEVNPNSITPRSYNLNNEEKNNLKIKYDIPTDKIICVYGGNIGKPQGIDYIVELLQENEKNQQIYFLIIGDGTDYNKLLKAFDKFKFKNSQLIKKIAKDEYEFLVSACDIGLIFLDYRFTIPNFPSRILSYMQASLPIIAATDINTDIGKIIEENNFGYWCESKNIDDFNRLLSKLYSSEVRKKLGQNAKDYLEQNYTAKKSHDIIMKHFIK